MKFGLLILFLATVATAMSHHLERVWTDEKVRKTKAEILKIENNCAVLRMPDGRELRFPIEKLSKIDQAFLETHDDELTEGGEEAKPGENFDAPWPSRVSFKSDPEIVIVEENKDEKKFIYESANYRYNCDVRLSKSVVKSFAVMFEATHQFVRELPLSVNGGERKNGKYQIILMDREKDGARIKNFLKALNAGKQGDEALAVLLDGQTWQELEADIAKAYSRKGVDFTFSE